jgi:hypothetical protein
MEYFWGEGNPDGKVEDSWVIEGLGNDVLLSLRPDTTNRSRKVLRENASPQFEEIDRGFENPWGHID